MTASAKKMVARGGSFRDRYPLAARSLAKIAAYSVKAVEKWGLLEAGEADPGLDVAGGFSINHVGMAVPSIEKFLEGNQVLYGRFRRTGPMVNDRQHVREMFLTDGQTVIELLEPTGEASPLWGFLRKNASGGLVHVCFDCDDIGDAVLRLKAAGGRLISGPTPDVAFGERPIAFLMVANQVVELVERPRRAGAST
jgi:methylmalonyl-CoA/ethylmalonyl-CoA epimerase